MMIPKHVKNLKDLYNVHEYIVKQIESETVCNRGLLEILFQDDFDRIGEQFIVIGLYYDGMKLVLIKSDLSLMGITGYDPQLPLSDPNYKPLAKLSSSIVDKASRIRDEWIKRDDEEVENAN